MLEAKGGKAKEKAKPDTHGAVKQLPGREVTVCSKMLKR
jgi:hypothetical protein